MRRKSQPFWKILGEQSIASTIVRVPITFPPERFHGRMLAAMSTPDLRGTQGSFSHFSTRIESAHYESGSRYPLKRAGEPDEIAKVAVFLAGDDASYVTGQCIYVDGGWVVT